MPNQVEIEIIAKDLASNIIGALQEKLVGLGATAQDIAAYGGIASLGVAMLNFERQSVDATVAFSDAVQEMKNVTGTTSIEAAKLVDLFDKFGLGAGEATAAARKLAQQGLTLNIDTIKKLAEQYQAIEDPAARQKFLMDNLGRSAFQYAEMLSLSSAKLDELNNGLTAGQTNVANNREEVLQYKMATKELSDAWESVKMELGMEVIPALTILLKAIVDNFEAIKQWGSILGWVLNPIGNAAKALGELIARITWLNSNPLSVGGGGGVGGGVGGGSQTTPKPGSVSKVTHSQAPTGGPLIAGVGGTANIGIGTSSAPSGNIITTIGDFFSNLFGGGKASGGDVYAGGAYVVGERGPELFRPTMNGTIIPNNKMASAGGARTVNMYFTQPLTLATIDYIAQEVGRRLS